MPLFNWGSFKITKTFPLRSRKLWAITIWEDIFRTKLEIDDTFSKSKNQDLKKLWFPIFKTFCYTSSLDPDVIRYARRRFKTMNFILRLILVCSDQMCMEKDLNYEFYILSDPDVIRCAWRRFINIYTSSGLGIVRWVWRRIKNMNFILRLILVW